jgi:adenylate kinase
MEDQTTKIKQIKEWLGSGTINIFGLPFSGKDTHGKELSAMLEGPLIGGGDILRSKLVPQHVTDAINNGNLAPTDDYREIVLPYLAQEKYAGKPLVLSSVGRWIGEEKSVLAATKSAGHPIKCVIYLQIPNDEVWKRWKINKRERHDDNAEHILEKRFSEFEEKTIPVVTEYRKLGLLLEIDGSPAEKVVTAEIINQLHKLTTNS